MEWFNDKGITIDALPDLLAAAREPHRGHQCALSENVGIDGEVSASRPQEPQIG